MQTAGALIMVLTVVAYLGCRIAGVRDVYILREAKLRFTFSRPATALDANYAVIAVRLLWLWLAPFLVGLIIFLVARAPNAA